jgi:hypothetical protein
MRAGADRVPAPRAPGFRPDFAVASGLAIFERSAKPSERVAAVTPDRKAA